LSFSLPSVKFVIYGSGIAAAAAAVAARTTTTTMIIFISPEKLYGIGRV